MDLKLIYYYAALIVQNGEHWLDGDYPKCRYPWRDLGFKDEAEANSFAYSHDQALGIRTFVDDTYITLYGPEAGVLRLEYLREQKQRREDEEETIRMRPTAEEERVNEEGESHMREFIENQLDPDPPRERTSHLRLIWPTPEE